jgi:hypothetical protein
MTAACRETRLETPVSEEFATRLRVTIATARTSRPVLDASDPRELRRREGALHQRDRRRDRALTARKAHPAGLACPAGTGA